MQGNTIVRNALPDMILPQDLEGTPYDPDEIRLGLRVEMKKQEFPDKVKAKDAVLGNLAKNRKYYSDLQQYMNSEKGNLMQTENKKKPQTQLEKGIKIEKGEHSEDIGDALCTVLAKNHLEKDKYYYEKADLAGLEDEKNEGALASGEMGSDHLVKECGCESDCDCAGPDVAGIEVDPSTLQGIVVAPAEEPQANVAAIKIGGDSQKSLSSSGLGSGTPNPLSSAEIEAPDPKKIGPNTVATTKTPVMTTSADPLDHFGSKIQSALSSIGKF